MARLLDLNLQCVPPRALPRWPRRSPLPGQPRHTMCVRALPETGAGREGRHGAGVSVGRAFCREKQDEEQTRGDSKGERGHVEQEAQPADH